MDITDYLSFEKDLLIVRASTTSTILHKENDSVEIIVTLSDVRYCPSSVLDIMYFRYNVRTHFTKR